MICLFGHKWDGCKCTKCGKTRDEGHVFATAPGSCTPKCIKCGKEGHPNHDWNRKCTCRICGATRVTSDTNEHRFPYIDNELSCTCELCGFNAGKWHHWAYTYVPGEAKHKDTCTICGATEMMQHYFEGKTCIYCGYETKIDIHDTIAAYAVYVDLGGYDEEEKHLATMEQALLAEGASAETCIFGFLARCSHGGVGNIRWWEQAKRLTQMLRKFNTPNVKQHLMQLVDNASRTKIWEYHTQIANVAKEELTKL